MILPWGGIVVHKVCSLECPCWLYFFQRRRRSDEVRFMHESEGEGLTEAGCIHVLRAGDAFLQSPRPRETDDGIGNALPASFEAAEACSTSRPCCWGPAACEVFACELYRLVGVAFVFDRLM